MKKESFIHHTRVCVKRYKGQKGINGHKMKYLGDGIRLLKRTAKNWGSPFFPFFIRFLWTFIRHGEISAEYYVGAELYKYNGAEKKRHLSVRRAFYLDYKFNIEASIAEENKTHFKNQFNACYKKFIKRDWIYPREATKEEVRSFIMKHEKVLCKPNGGTNGHGLFILTKDNITDEILESLKEKDLIVEEFIKQCETMAKLHEKSVNTLRIFTVIDRDGNVHIDYPQPYLRVGTGDGIADNTHAGGLYYMVDSETGIVYTRGKSASILTKFICHPGTDIVMLGFKVPKYKEICTMIKEAAKVIPHLRYVGWDVAITDNGPELIEGNVSYAGNMSDGDGIYRQTKKYL